MDAITMEKVIATSKLQINNPILKNLNITKSPTMAMGETTESDAKIMIKIEMNLAFTICSLETGLAMAKFDQDVVPSREKSENVTLVHATAAKISTEDALVLLKSVFTAPKISIPINRAGMSRRM